MRKRFIFLGLPLLLLTLLVFLWPTLYPAEPVDFSTDIKPILNQRCIVCHGGVKKNSDLGFLFREDALGATKSGKPAIIPGDANGSELIRRVREHDPELRMPYEKSPLSEDEIQLLADWIDQGAKWGKHWAYTLPEKVAVPKIQTEAGFGPSVAGEFLVNPIDHFILATLQSEELSPSPQAEKTILARRLAFDLTGLPPEDHLFRNWMSGGLTYEAMVDSLLAQPAFGEKWASWWLDLARYSDTKGYEKDQGRSIWRYRDWVINAFNSDMPYDQFTMEQLAGDLLPDPSVNQLIATAFHRNTMNNDEGGTEDEEFRVAGVIDRVNTTFEVWQSTTIGCVQCHSHTYDPFKHDEYYRLFAFFNNSLDEDTPGDEPALKFYPEKEKEDFRQICEWAAKYGDDQVSREYSDFISFNEPVYQAHDCVDFTNGELADTKWLALWDDGSCYLRDINTLGAGYIYLKYWSEVDGTEMRIRKNDRNGEILSQFRIDKTRGQITRRIPFKKTEGNVTLYIEVNNDLIPDQVSTSYILWLGFLRDLPGKGETGYQAMNDRVVELLNTTTPTHPIMVENPDYMKRTTQVFERGNWLLKGDTVSPATPSILNTWKTEWPQNRLGLSKWIVSKENPLTARTVVNRVWHQLFGRGIVPSLEDLGTQSDPPSHPELLDWLALQFMNEQHWKIKSLIREMVLSGTYRQESVVAPAIYQRDPENALYARGPRTRLTAEQIRDQALSVSGLLSKKMYGPGVMPPQPEGIWKSVYSGEKWIESEGEDKFRRGIYTYLKRSGPYPSFITFDAGSREVCTVRRTVTNTPLQALVTLNDPVYFESAFYLAASISDQIPAREKIRNCYKKATFREISEPNLAVLEQLYQSSLTTYESDGEALKNFNQFKQVTPPSLAALTVVANAIMNLDEFLTKS